MPCQAWARVHDATTPQTSATETAKQRFGEGTFAGCVGTPCTRANVARVTLLAIGALAGAAAAALLFGLGDRRGGGEPSTLLVGGGATAGIGALMGLVAGRLTAREVLVDDRVRPATVGLDAMFPRAADQGERFPGTMGLSVAPTLMLGEGGSRVRFLGSFAAPLGTTTEVDPRPTAARDAVALHERVLRGSLALDLAVALPYPVRPAAHASYLGRAELRYRPSVQFRREMRTLAQGERRTVERTMFLPLTVGARWHLSPRQRFTFYVGPRFDFVAFSEGSGKLRRGRPLLAPMYGEAWWDLDIPFSKRAARNTVVGMFSLGYLHSRFESGGVNLGPVAGYMGSVMVRMVLRVRPHGSPLAFQPALDMMIGSMLTLGASFGVVLPSFVARNKGAR